jgi:hypothetical protein
MLRKASGMLISLGVLTAILLSGCGGPAATMKLQFAPQEQGQYVSSILIVKDFRFEQPNVDKLREEQTKTEIDMGFDQVIKSVDEEGNATADITITSLKTVIVNKNEQRFTFDSTQEADKNNPMAQLIGKSYTIKLTPDGKANIVDAQAVRQVVKSGYEKRVADSLLEEKAISERHSVPAMPKEKQDGLSVKDSWTEVVPSPPGLLAPKNYTKTYTITGVDGNVATVEMAAGESGEAAGAAGGMGMFAKMFDNEDTFTGTLKFDIVNGDVLLSEETLISTYIAQETPENGDPAKGPDTLTMRFTNKNRLEKIN